ncbi:hypothetical protein KR009_001826, partial [Drosophila setifemur]
LEMSGPPSNVQSLRCLHCMKVIHCSRYDTGGLVLHIKQDHPEIFEEAGDKIKNLHKLAEEHGISEERLSQISKMTGLSESQMADEAVKYMAKKNMGSARNSIPMSTDRKDTPRDQSPSAYSASSKDQGSCSRSQKEQRHRKQCYKASIERWAPTEGLIFCPSCGCSRRPMVKAASELVNTGCCAACVISCWPLCFLPCLLSPENREYLYCSNCRCFLGIYDRDTNCVKPSREFVSCGKCATPPAKSPCCPSEKE